MHMCVWQCVCLPATVEGICVCSYHAVTGSMCRILCVYVLAMYLFAHNVCPNMNAIHTDTTLIIHSHKFCKTVSDYECPVAECGWCVGESLCALVCVCMHLGAFVRVCAGPLTLVQIRTDYHTDRGHAESWEREKWQQDRDGVWVCVWERRVGGP